jgi:hypothetical protein
MNNVRRSFFGQIIGAIAALFGLPAACSAICQTPRRSLLRAAQREKLMNAIEDNYRGGKLHSDPIILSGGRLPWEILCTLENGKQYGYRWVVWAKTPEEAIAKEYVPKIHDQVGDRQIASISVSPMHNLLCNLNGATCERTWRKMIDRKSTIDKWEIIAPETHQWNSAAGKWEVISVDRSDTGG